MAIETFLKSLNATHLFTLNNSGTLETDDKGDSVDPTNIKDGVYTFSTDRVCEGFTHSLQSSNATDVTTRTDGAIFDNREDINGATGDGNGNSLFEYVTDVRSCFLWMRTTSVDTPTCIYKQGAISNNFAFIVGVAKSITWQAADEGQSFLITQSKSKAQENRNYFLSGTWEHTSKSAGTGNKIGFYINGVLQESAQSAEAIEAFPEHAGPLVLGNSSNNLKTYNEADVPFATRKKYLNLFGLYNNVLLTPVQMREIFERTVIPVLTIAADTVANQQAALDALKNSGYADNNCAIRIIQATGVTDYRIFIDAVSFKENSDLGDIAIQYVGPNTLTLENTNGSNVVITSAPAEVELVQGILPGGGSIVLVENTVRKDTPGSFGNLTATKLVISTAGDYRFDALNVSEVENVSGGIVNISALNPVDKETNTSGTLNLGVRGKIELNEIISSSIYVQDADGVEIEFSANFTGDRVVDIPSSSVGAWKWVISRPGYEKILGTADSGKINLQNISYAQKFDLGTGLSLYSGMESANLSFAIQSGKIIGTFLGDVSAQFFFNQLETFLSTKIGCKWLVDNPDSAIIQISTDFAGQLLILPDNVAVQSTTTGTKKLSAFVVTNEKPFERSFFGVVSYNTAESSAEISKAVWDYLSIADTVSGSMQEQVGSAKAHAMAANIQTQKS